MHVKTAGVVNSHYKQRANPHRRKIIGHNFLRNLRLKFPENSLPAMSFKDPSRVAGMVFHRILQAIQN